MKNDTKITTNLLDIVQLIDENEVQSEMGAAFASFMLNPSVTWVKFVLTDDMTNANGQRVPKEEFASLLRSGIHMPVKMAVGKINQGHEGSSPLGTITHLKEIENEDGTSAVVALAALWGQERPEDVKLIKERFQKKEPVDISWEILYRDEIPNEAKGSRDLSGTALRAATIVGDPAYQGRTPILAVASKQEEKDPAKLAEEELNEIETLKAQVAELENKLAEATKQLEAKASAESEKDAEIARLTEENKELVSLREYKAAIEAEAAKIEKLDNIKKKFVEAGIEKDDSFFSENGEKLASMDETALDFMVQELKAFAESSKTSVASKTTKKIPNLVGSEEEVDLADPKVLAKLLREHGKK